MAHNLTTFDSTCCATTEIKDDSLLGADNVVENASMGVEDRGVVEALSGISMIMLEELKAAKDGLVGEESCELLEATDQFEKAFRSKSDRLFEQFERLEDCIHYGYGAPLKFLGDLIDRLPDTGEHEWSTILESKKGIINSLLKCSTLRWEWSQAMSMMQFGDQRCKDYVLAATCLAHIKSMRAKDSDFSPKAFKSLYALYFECEPGIYYTIKDFALHFTHNSMIYEFHAGGTWSLFPTVPVEVGVKEDVATMINDTIDKLTRQLSGLTFRHEHTVNLGLSCDASSMQVILGISLILVANWTDMCSTSYRSALTAVGVVMLGAHKAVRDIVKDSLEYFRKLSLQRDNAETRMVPHVEKKEDENQGFLMYVLSPFIRTVQYVIFGESAKPEMVWKGLSTVEAFNKADATITKAVDRLMDMFVLLVDRAINFGIPGAIWFHPYSDLRDNEIQIRNTLRGLQSGELHPTRDLLDKMFIVNAKVKEVFISTNPNTVKGRYVANIGRMAKELDAILKTANLAQGMRPETRAFVFVGPPGGGKTTIMNLLLPSIAVAVSPPEVRDLVAEKPELIVSSININSNFADTVQPWTKVIVTDEMFVSKDVEGSENKNADLLIKMCSCTPYNIEKAAVEEKGNVWCNASVFLGCSNLTKLDRLTLKSYTDPEAIVRRIRAYLPVPRPMFCENPKAQLHKRVLMKDKSKLPPVLDPAQWWFYQWDYGKGKLMTDADGKALPPLDYVAVLAQITADVETAKRSFAAVSGKAANLAKEFSAAMKEGKKLVYKDPYPDADKAADEGASEEKAPEPAAFIEANIPKELLVEGGVDSFEDPDTVKDIKLHSGDLTIEAFKMILALAVTACGFRLTMNEVKRRNNMLPYKRKEGETPTEAYVRETKETIADNQDHFKITLKAFVTGLKINLGYYDQPNAVNLTQAEWGDMLNLERRVPITGQILLLALTMCSGMTFGKKIYLGVYRSLLATFPEDESDAVEIMNRAHELSSGSLEKVAMDYVALSRDAIFAEANKVDTLWDFISVNWLYVGISAIGVAVPAYRLWKAYNTVEELSPGDKIEATDLVVDITGDSDKEAAALVSDIAHDLDVSEKDLYKVLVGHSSVMVTQADYNEKTLARARMVAARRKARLRRKANKAKGKLAADLKAVEEKVDVSVVMEAHADISTDLISSHMTTNIKLIGLKDDKYMGTVLGIGGHYALVNRHFKRLWEKCGNPILRVKCNKDAPDCETSLRDLEFHELHDADLSSEDESLKSDIMIVKFPRYFPKFKNIVSSFIPIDYVFREGMRMWLPLRAHKTRNSDMVVLTRGAKAGYTMSIQDEDLENIKVKNFLIIDTPTMPGDCGTPVYVEKGGALKIAGIVAFGNGSDRCCAPIVTAEDLSWIEKFVAHGEYLVAGKPGNVEFVDIYQGDAKIPNMYPIAKWNGPNSHVISNKCTTDLKGAFDEIGLSDPIAPAKLRKFRSGDEVIDPLVKACAVYCANTKYIPVEKLKRIQDVLVRHYAVNGVMPICPLADLTFLSSTMEDVVYGVEGLYHSMPSDTAVGPSLEEYVPGTWVGPKRKYFIGDGRDSKGPGWDFLVASVSNIIIASENKDVHFVTRLELKDELRSIKKVQNGQTRAYFVAPLELQILIRITYLSITQAFVNAGIQSGTAVGANPATEWTMLANHLKLYDNVLDSDFSGYDGSITSQLILSALDVLDKLCPTSDSTHLNIRRIIRDNLAYAWVIVSGFVYRMFGNNSGNGLTIFINCIITHTVTLLCAAIYVANNCSSLDANGEPVVITDDQPDYLSFDPERVFKQLYMCAMGDDLIASLGGELENFTTKDFAVIAASCVGFKVTNSDKTDPYVNPRFKLKLSEVSFLKRNFVEDDYKGFIAPLDLQSIRKQCEWSEVRILDNKPEVFRMTVQEAIMELSLHGKETFEKYVNCIRRRLIERKRPELLPDMMNYDLCRSIMVGRAEGTDYFREEIFDSSMKFHMEAPTTTTIGDEVAADLTVTTPSLVSPYEVKGTSIEDFFSKPWLVTTGTWDTAQAMGEDVLPLPGGLSTDYLLTLNPLWVSKWEGFSMVRGDIEFTLEVNTTPFHSGELLMHFLPLAQAFSSVNDSYVKMHNFDITTRSMQPSVVYNCRDTGAHMTIPYVAPTEYYVLAKTGTVTTLPSYQRGSLHLSVQAPLSIGTTGATVVTYAIYARFLNVELVAPMVPHAGGSKFKKSKGKRVTDEKELEETSKGTISSALDVAASVAGALTSVPMLAPLTGPAEIFLRGAAGIASFFGFDKPMNNLGITPVVDQPMRYGATCDGVVNTVPLGLMTNNKVRLLDTKSITGEDEMSFNFLKRRFALINTYAWDAADSPSTVLQLQSAGPQVNAQGDILLSPANMFRRTSYVSAGGSAVVHTGPPIWYLSNLFTLYRGSITIILRFVKTDYHSGRVQVTYTPRSDAPSPNLTTSQYAMRTIVDIRDTTEVSFTLPYLSPTPYMDMSQYMGSFSVRILTELRAPETCVQEIPILMYVAGGPDFELQLPGTRGIRSNLWSFVPHMEKSSSTSSSVPLVPGTSMGRPEASFTAAEECVGEYFTSVRQLLQRTMAVYHRTALASSAVTNVWPFFISVGKISGGAISSPSYGGDVYSYIATMFALYRGSMRLYMDTHSHSMSHAILNPALVVTGRNCVSGDDISRNGWTNAVGPATTDWRSSSTVMQPTGHTCLDTVPISNQWNTKMVHVPYYSKTSCSLAVPTYNDLLPATLTGLEPSVPFGAVAVYNQAGGSGFSRSIGEDFQLMYFVGCPPVTVGNVTPS